MRFLKTNTATRVTVGPFLDKTDGITPETALTVTNEKLTLCVDDGGVPTLVLDTAPTASGGNNDMVHITNDDAGFYDLELTAANLNYVGRAILSLTDAANHCPVFHEFMILPAKVYDSLVGGTDNLEVDTIQVGGTTQTGRDLGASVLLSPGTGTGQISLSGGAVTVSRPTGSVVSDAGNSATAFKTDLSSAVDDFWVGAYLKITSGALSGQVRKVADYNGTTKIVTLAAALTGTPADGVTFALVNE